jgi:hypothetical protein
VAGGAISAGAGGRGAGAGALAPVLHPAATSEARATAARACRRDDIHPYSRNSAAGDAENGCIMNRPLIWGAIGALKLVFWGAVLCALDFTFASTTNGVGFRFDVLNDIVGTLLIARGVFRLSEAAVMERQFHVVMRYIRVVSILMVLAAVRGHFVLPPIPVLDVVFHVIGVLSLVALVAFCLALCWLCREAGLEWASQSWRVTAMLFGVIYLAPLGFLQVAAIVALLVGTAAPGGLLGAAGALLFVVMAVPVVHLLVSAVRTRQGLAEPA